MCIYNIYYNVAFYVNTSPTVLLTLHILLLYFRSTFIFYHYKHKI